MPEAGTRVKSWPAFGSMPFKIAHTLRQPCDKPPRPHDFKFLLVRTSGVPLPNGTVVFPAIAVPGERSSTAGRCWLIATPDCEKVVPLLDGVTAIYLELFRNLLFEWCPMQAAHVSESCLTINPSTTLYLALAPGDTELSCVMTVCSNTDTVSLADGLKALAQSQLIDRYWTEPEEG